MNMLHTKTISIKTLGCKLNFSESATIEQHLAAQGYTIIKDESAADAYIINTCAVTETAEKKCRQMIHHMHQQNAMAKIVLVGCYGALEQSQVLANEVDYILGSHNKMQILTIIDQLLKGEAVHIEADGDDDTFFSSYSLHERTRSFLKIQDGCDYHCSYCTVCIARGYSRNDSIANVIDNAYHIVAHGIKEVVLSGVNLGDFKVNGQNAFYELLQQLVQVEGLERIRISSIEPNLLTSSIIQLAADHPQLLPHFHLPLQSGNNRILGLMHRRYKREFFAQKIQEIKAILPQSCVAADVITGFPTETEEDFMDTYRFLEGIPVNMLHVFPYSRRPHTIAAGMDGQVPQGVKNNRTLRLIELSNKKKAQFYKNNEGGCYSVLVEHKQENGYTYGFTENYIKVKVPADMHMEGQIIRVRLLHTDKDGIYNIKII